MKENIQKTEEQNIQEQTSTGYYRNEKGEIKPIGCEEKYDERGNLIYEKRWKTENWREYDEQDREIHGWNNSGLEWWNEYDKKGVRRKNIMRWKDGREEIRHYPERGGIIYDKFAENDERWWYYDKNGNLIYHRRSDGYDEWTEYDDQERMGKEWNSKGDERKLTYDEDGNKVQETGRTASGEYRLDWEYDDQGREVKYSDGEMVNKTTYNKDGTHTSHKTYSDGKEVWTYHDEDGRLIGTYHSNPTE